MKMKIGKLQPPEDHADDWWKRRMPAGIPAARGAYLTTTGNNTLTWAAAHAPTTATGISLANLTASMEIPT